VSPGASAAARRRTTLFWVARIDHEVRRATDEVFRSAELLARKERTASTARRDRARGRGEAPQAARYRKT
jgi:hypothetical protein